MSAVTCEPICQWCGEPIAVNEPSCTIHGMPCHIGCDDKVMGCEEVPVTEKGKRK